jgi:hypothetical protein
MGAAQVLDGELMLYIVPPSHICQAWTDGAHHLGIACNKAAGEVTGDQLKMLLIRGEKILMGYRNEHGQTVGWAAVSIDQHPNRRVLFVYAIWAPAATGQDAMQALKEFAKAEGCDSIRGACNEAIERLWARKFDAKRVYAIVEIGV